ncbi:helix-turn-helix transcriptional regulator [Microlunatus speluncae]|uniref:helix-turn-helix transcriptional regulator n=1 Tax=Microlunatus speluncae TaxID=2594267 RepID=UPI0012663E9A|nr:LuxR family transcriptional regulator [Microlunatus speluncae]
MTERSPVIIGRSGEQARLQRLIGEAKDGRSRSLVLRGEAGIGKSTLLNYAEAIAGDLRVLRVIGVESEAEIPYAGLQVLLAPYVDRIDGLPGPQARALNAVFGRTEGPGDQMLVGAATLTLLSELAEPRPLLCLLDDAHWFDQSSVAALLFAIRRLQADPVAMIFAARDGDRPFRADGVDSLELRRLDHDQAARLLAAVRALPHDTVERVLRETAGNPLAILELAAEDPTRPEAPPMAPLPAVGRLEQHFRAQLALLPEPTRRALAIAAADHGSDLGGFTAAAARLGLDLADLEPAEARRLVRVGGSVEFRHPLIRAAAYQGLPVTGRLAVHRAWADTLTDSGDADHRAWHLAAATTGVDDAVAAELERAALRALDRGAPAAASRAWERAAQLSTVPADRARRRSGAARMAYDAGESDRADQLAAAVGPAAAPSERADAAWVRAQVAYERDSPSRAATLAMDAVTPILAIDPERADSMLAEAAWCARDAADPELIARCADLLRSDPRAGVLREALAGMTAMLLGDTPAVPAMRALLLAVRDGQLEPPVQRLSGGFLGILIGADELARSVLERFVARIRDEGQLGWLPYALEPLALAQLVTGRFRDAEVTVAEATSLAGELDQPQQAAVLTSIAAWLAAVRGDDAACDRLAAAVLHGDGAGGPDGVDRARHRMAAATTEWALAIVELTRPDPAAAADRLERLCRGTARHDLTLRAIPDLVEAAARGGEPDRARRLLPVLRDWAGHTESPTLQALALRCAAIIDPGDAAADLFERAVATVGVGPYDLARTRLAYGEWLRRHRRPTAAQTQLTAALEAFDRLAARGWQRRVEAELTALGVALPDHPADAGRGPGTLTPQELQVVRLAGEGLTNREIAAQLFLSPRTIGYHLYKAYPKLGVARRAELARLEL